MRKRRSFKKLFSYDFHDLFNIWKEEIKNVFSDGGVIIFFFLVPLLYPVLYALIYNTETVTEVPTVVIDDSRSSLSREFARKIDATPNVNIVSYAANLDEAQPLLHEHKAYGIVQIPSDFSKKLNRGEQTSVILFADMNSMLAYKALLISCTNISLEMGAKLQTRHLEGATRKQLDMSLNPVRSDSFSIYNPQSGFASFLVPCILILIIQQTLILGITMLAGTAYENNSYKTLLKFQRKSKGSIRIVAAKAMVYLALYLIISVWLLVLVPAIFDLPQMGNVLDILVFLVPYLLACIFFAMTLTLFIKDRESPMVIFVFTSVVFMFISGVSWPYSAVPQGWKYVAQLIPSTAGIQGFIKLNTMGAHMQDIRSEYWSLWVLAAGYFLCSCFVYRWHIIRSRIDAIRNVRKC